MKKIIFLFAIVVTTLSSCQSYCYVSQESQTEEIRKQITVCEKKLNRYENQLSSGDSSAIHMVELYRHQLMGYEQALADKLSSTEERVSINTNDPYGGSVFMNNSKNGSTALQDPAVNNTATCLLLVQNRFRKISQYYDIKNTVDFTVYKVKVKGRQNRKLQNWSLSEVNWNQSVVVISGTIRPEENKALQLNPGYYVVKFSRQGKNYYDLAVLDPSKSMALSQEDLIGTNYSVNQINAMVGIKPK